jgi:putative inorganic carbon (HCO3(-)) transporter
VPPAVQQRVLMSYDTQTRSVDNSAATRLVLWQDAVEVFRTSPLLGTGFNTYAYMHREKRADGGEGYYEDTHNFYLKVLVETGVAGLLIFLWLLAKMFGIGYSLFRQSKDPFLASLGLGLAAWLICAATANFFGDRWTYFQVNGYMWVLGGLVARACLIVQGSLQSSMAKEADGTSRLDEAVGQFN